MTNLDREDGFRYEKLVANYFSQELRCIVINNSVVNSKKDSGIDLIAIQTFNNFRQIYLIQCKNYRKGSYIKREQIDRYCELKDKFIRNALSYDKNDSVNLIFCVSNKIFKSQDFAYAKEKGIQIMELAIDDNGTSVILKNKKI